MKIVKSPLCHFCREQNETLIHLFCNCKVTLDHWSNLQAWLRPILNMPDLTPESALLGKLEVEALKALFTQHFQVHGYNTRNKNDLHATHYHKKSYGCRKISYRARQHWNSLPPSLKNKKSFTKFKNSVKKHYLSQY